MPPARKFRRKPPPEGWEEIEPTLDDFQQKLRDAENDPHEGKRKIESTWKIMKINHQQSRYVYDLHYRHHTISRELYDYCLKEGFADKNLVAKWKKSGYEKLCCLQCIRATDSSFGGTCICRVPRESLDEDRVVECVNCGCRGCASCD